MAVEIRRVKMLAEYHACEAIQRQAWAMPHDLEVVPLHLLLTAQKNGGLLLGAFDGDEVVGFVFGFVGLTAEGQVKHCSHMMGVLPGLQSSGIGYRLKMAQRQAVLAQGLELITWTYDPLESRNAYLNVAKLGGVARTYVRDLYGTMADGLNAGLPSDRFEIDWRISSEWVERRSRGEPAGPWPEPALPAIETFSTADALVAPGKLHLDVTAPTIRVEIPADYQAIKATDAGLARDWRLTTRQVFESYFAAGYAAVDFVSRPVGDVRRSYYILCAQDLPEGQVLPFAAEAAPTPPG